MTKWHLNPKEVGRTFGLVHASSITHTRPYDRKNQLRTYQPILIHYPTKISVTKTLGPAQHSKKEWSRLTDQAFDEMFPELEKKVARFLKIPGH